MYETLSRSHDPTFLVAPGVENAIERIGQVEKKREKRREGQIEEARLKREDKKRVREEEEDKIASAITTATALVGEGEGEEGKAEKLEMELESEEQRDERPSKRLNLDPSVVAAPPPFLLGAQVAVLPAVVSDRSVVGYTFKAGSQLRGHTSYLTFGTLLPRGEHVI